MKKRLLFSKRMMLAVFCLMILMTSGPSIRLSVAEPFFFPNPESKNVLEASLASDGSRLVLFYSYLDPERDPWRPNMVYGTLKEWNGTRWVDRWEPVGHGTNYCYDPDSAVLGKVILALHRYTAYGSHRVRYHSNFSGSWEWGTTGTFYSIKRPRAAFAFGVPYVTYTSIGSGGPNKVYIECLYSCDDLPELHGTYRSFGSLIPVEVASATALAGDEEAFYSAFVSALVNTTSGTGCVNVRKVTRDDDNYLGDCFAMGDGPRDPDIALFSGEPVTVWKEEAGQALYVARWNGLTWVIIGVDLAAANSNFGRHRIDCSEAELYVGYEVNDGAKTEIIVSKFDGSNWNNLSVPFDSADTSNISFQDIAVYKDRPIVAFTDDKVLKIVSLVNGSLRSSVTQPLLQLLLLDK